MIEFSRFEVAMAAAAFALMPLAGAALGAAYVARGEAPAVEARLFGVCNGKLMAAAEESAFPESGCEWIEKRGAMFEGFSDSARAELQIGSR